MNYLPLKMQQNSKILTFCTDNLNSFPAVISILFKELNI